MSKLAVLLLLVFPSVVNAIPLRTPEAGAEMLQVTGFSTNEVKAVIEQLAKWDSDDAVTEVWIRIDTTGGSIENGMRLVRFIENMQTPVVCMADYKAFSFGMILLQSCKERVMTKRSVLMVHGVVASGIDSPMDSHDLVELSKNIDATSRAMMHGMLERLNVSENEYMLRTGSGHEWWMDYTDAVKYGAVDAYADPKQLPRLTPVQIPPQLLLFGLPQP